MYTLPNRSSPISRHTGSVGMAMYRWGQAQEGENGVYAATDPGKEMPLPGSVMEHISSKTCHF